MFIQPENVFSKRRNIGSGKAVTGFIRLRPVESKVGIIAVTGTTLFPVGKPLYNLVPIRNVLD
jgi:hypothetical protein